MLIITGVLRGLTAKEQRRRGHRSFETGSIKFPSQLGYRVIPKISNLPRHQKNVSVRTEHTD